MSQPIVVDDDDGTRGESRRHVSIRMSMNLRRARSTGGDRDGEAGAPPNIEEYGEHSRHPNGADCPHEPRPAGSSDP